MSEVYFVGKGLTFRPKPQEINNLYKPTTQYKIENFDYVHVMLFESPEKKFIPILLKELFFLLKPKGYLVIEYTENKNIHTDSLEEFLWWSLRGNYNIIEHTKDKGQLRLVVEKKKTMFAKGDSINKWTFGIVTNGDRDNWVEEIIQSIRKQDIPNYEIIVCGKYRDRKEKDFIYIDFNERSDKGWITKKKNLIAEKAKYENLCIIHDRLVFDKDWYKAMKRYGNAFELLGCRQIEKITNEFAGDWITLGGPIYTEYKISRLRDTDWDYNVYLSGQLTIIKKSIWEKILWDESRFWYEWEDVDISFRARDAGFLIRFNPYAIVFALTWKHGKIPLKYNISEGLLPKDMLLRRCMRMIVKVVYKIPFIKTISPLQFSWFFKSKLYKHLSYH